MRVMLAALAICGAFTTAGAGAFMQATAPTAPAPRHPLLEWWPVILFVGGVLVSYVMLRSQATQTALDLAKKADREIIDLKFAGVDTRFDGVIALIEAKFDAVNTHLDSMRREMESNRVRRHTGGEGPP